MFSLLFTVLTQSMTFLPLALGISISYTIMRATDMTIDGSFVVGAAVFARLVTLGASPLLAFLCALFAGAAAGLLTAGIQRQGRIDPLLAGVLATFILSSSNLILMNKPNINLLSVNTLLSFAFAISNTTGWLLVAAIVALISILVIFLLKTSFGLALRAFGTNPELFQRMGYSQEGFRIMGFALTNMLSAAAGCLTAQTVGYADINMGFGMTLTGIGAIILGQQIFYRITHRHLIRIGGEFVSCIIGVVFYFFALNALLRFNIDPLYLKLILGLTLVFFLRTANRGQRSVLVS